MGPGGTQSQDEGDCLRPQERERERGMQQSVLLPLAMETLGSEKNVYESQGTNDAHRFLAIFTQNWCSIPFTRCCRPTGWGITHHTSADIKASVAHSVLLSFGPSAVV